MKKYLLLLTVAAMLWTTPVPAAAAAGADQKTAAADADVLLISAKDLKKDTVSFIRLSDDSKIELLARIGDDGKPKAALDTCQACNGSPKAYFTQEGELLKCNNCGLKFELSAIDAPSAGCNPMPIDPSIIRYTEDGIILDKAALLEYEPLFAKIEEHGEET